MCEITLSRVIPNMSVQTDFFIHSKNFSLNHCENSKIQYLNAQMKATDLELIEEESGQNATSRILFEII